MIAIAAMSQNRVIGKDGKLPWPSIKEDFKHFRNITMNKTIVVGSNTFRGLPPLKGRTVCVVTRNKTLWGTGVFAGDAVQQYYSSLNNVPADAIVCGGAEIYSLLLPICETLYLTLIKKDYEGDTVMPDFEHLFTATKLILSTPEFEIQKYEQIR